MAPVRIAVLLALGLTFANPAFSFASQPDAQTIIQRSTEANERDWNALPEYDCFERDEQAGQPAKTYKNLMIFGSPYQELVAINGKPLSASQQQEQKEKLQAAIASRRQESAQERSQRVAEYQKTRDRNHLLMRELVRAFDFKVVGHQELNGYKVYVLAATPRPGYQPPSRDAKVLTGMQGKLWIDEQSFQWVKVEAEVIHSVSIEGFLAKVDPGTRFELEKMPVGDGIWLPKHFMVKSKAKVFFFFTRRFQENQTYYGYHKASRN